MISCYRDEDGEALRACVRKQIFGFLQNDVAALARGLKLDSESANLNVPDTNKAEARSGVGAVARMKSTEKASNMEDNARSELFSPKPTMASTLPPQDIPGAFPKEIQDLDEEKATNAPPGFLITESIGGEGATPSPFPEGEICQKEEETVGEAPGICSPPGFPADTDEKPALIITDKGYEGLNAISPESAAAPPPGFPTLQGDGPSPDPANNANQSSAREEAPAFVKSEGAENEGEDEDEDDDDLC